jgi:hypothetical protein
MVNSKSKFFLNHFTILPVICPSEIKEANALRPAPKKEKNHLLPSRWLVISVLKRVLT